VVFFGGGFLYKTITNINIASRNRSTPATIYVGTYLTPLFPRYKLIYIYHPHIPIPLAAHQQPAAIIWTVI